MSQASAQVASVTLRITRRGRIVLTGLVTILAAAVLSIAAMFGATQAQASTDEQSGQATSFSYVVALPGDSFWSLATRIAPEADPRDVIADMMRLNQLSSADLTVGQELAVPAHWMS